MLSHPLFSRCLVAAVLLALVSPLTPAGQSAVRAAEYRPAETAVIAQGVAPLPGPSTAWRVERSSVLTADENNAQGHALGFAVADRDGFSVTDEDTGARMRLSRGEAVFNAEGSTKTFASLGDERVQRVMIELWPTEPIPVPMTEVVIYAGEPFDAPSGDRDVDLLTAVVDDETSLSLDSSKAPALVYAPDGLRYGVEGVPNQILAPGEAKEFRGPVTIFAPSGQQATSSGRARVYAAVIGSALSTDGGNDPSGVAVEENGTAELRVLLGQCPEGTLAIPGRPADVNPCDPDLGLVPSAVQVPSVVIAVQNQDNGAEFTLTTDEFGAASETVSAGTYRVVMFDGIPASSRAVISTCVSTNTGDPQADLIVDELTLDGGDQVTCSMLADGGTFALGNGGGALIEPTTDGTITFEVRSCPEEYVDYPEGVPAQGDGLVSCDGDLSLDETSPVNGAQVTLNGPDGSVAFEYTGPDGVVVFTGLTEGDYTAVLMYGTATLASHSQCGGQTADGRSSGLLGPISASQAQELPPGGSLNCTFLTGSPTIKQVVGSALIVQVLSCPNGTNLPTVQADGIYDCGGSPMGDGFEVVAIDDEGRSQGGFTGGDGTLTLEVEPGQQSLSFPFLEGSAFGLCSVPGVGLSGSIDGFMVGEAETVECTVQVLNPSDAGASQSADSDGDFLTDPQEDRLGTDPDDSDSDDDGTVDGYEVYLGTDPMS